MDALTSALLLVLALLPGVVLWHSYFQDPFSRRALELPRGLEVAWYLFLAVPLLLVWINLWPKRYSPSPAQMLRLSDLVAGAEVDPLNNWFVRQAVGWLGLVALAYAIGVFMRRIVWSLRLDLWVPPLQIRNDWYYPLRGRLRELPRVVVPVADVLATDSQVNRLYRGVVVDFDLSKDGRLAAITMEKVLRGKKRGKEFHWVDVPGHRMVIIGEGIHSINLTYLDPDTGEAAKERKSTDPWHRRGANWLRAVARSFVTLEP